MASRTHLAVFASLFMTLIIDNMGLGLIFPVLSPIFAIAHGGILPEHASLALRDILYSVTLGAFGVGMFIGAPILGDLSDQIGRKKVLLVCLIGTACGFFICALGIKYSIVSLLIIGRGLGGLMAGCMPIAQAAIIDISTPENKLKNISSITLALCVGFAIGPMVGGYFSNHAQFPWFNYATPFFLAGFLALFNALCMFITFSETFIPPPQIKVNMLKGISLFIDAFRHDKVRKLTLMLLCQQIAWSLYFQFVSLFLVQEYHFTSVSIGHFMSYLGLWFGLTMLGITRIFLRWFEETALNILCLVVLTLCMGVLVISHLAIINWIIVAPLAVCLGMSYAVTLTLLSNLVKHDEQGWIMGIATSVMAGSWGITGLLAGPFAFISARFPFVICTLMMFGSLLLMWSYNRQNPGNAVSANVVGAAE